MQRRATSRFRKNSLTAAATATTAIGAGAASAAIIHVDPADITLNASNTTHIIDFAALPLASDLFLSSGISKGTQPSWISTGGAAANGFHAFGDTFGHGDLVVNGTFMPHLDIGENVYLEFGVTSDGSNLASNPSVTHFGWVRLTQTAVDEVVIHEWAYQDQANVAIFAGEGGTFTPEVAVPEPGTLLMFAVGAAIAMRIHAKRKHQ